MPRGFNVLPSSVQDGIFGKHHLVVLHASEVVGPALLYPVGKSTSGVGSPDDEASTLAASGVAFLIPFPKPKVPLAHFHPLLTTAPAPMNSPAAPAPIPKAAVVPPKIWSGLLIRWLVALVKPATNYVCHSHRGPGQERTPVCG